MNNKIEYEILGPILSQSHPKKSRAKTVMPTEAMMMLPICAFERPRSARTIGINGAIPNHPKKHRKNVNQVTWNARIGAVLKVKRLILEAFSASMILRIILRNKSK